jgi:hypothetical protein
MRNSVVANTPLEDPPLVTTGMGDPVGLALVVP